MRAGAQLAFPQPFSPPNIAACFLMQLDAQPTVQAHEIIQGADESQEPNNHIAW